jgi:hypothetical protein
MQQNVDMILDRQEQLESLEAKSSELQKHSLAFRKSTRAIRRWHLMNQVPRTEKRMCREKMGRGRKKV